VTEARLYIERLRAETRRLAAAGVSAGEAADQLDESMRALHPDWVQSEWIAFGVRHFHAATAAG